MDKPPSLELTLQRLHESGIAAGVESSPEDGMRVWIGDEIRKVDATSIHPVTTIAGRRWVNGSAAARWLIEAAVRLFPNSRFGLDHRARG